MHYIKTNICGSNHRDDVLRLYQYIVWCLGLTFGLALGKYTSGIFLKQIANSLLSRISFWGGFAVGTAPLVVAFLLLRFFAPELLFPLLFLKACCFGFCFCSATVAFGTAAWLMRPLCLFSNVAGNVIFLVFVSTQFAHERSGISKRFLHSLLLFFVVTVFDYFVLSPYTAMF